LAGALLLMAPGVDAAPQPIALGQVTARAGKDRARLAAELRRALTAELTELAAGQHAPRDGWVLSASIVRLDSRPTSEGIESLCVISATLERDGALRATIRGSARAIDRAPAAELSALRAAARGALRRLPEALR
jgi:hypothetical protein